MSIVGHTPAPNIASQRLLERLLPERGREARAVVLLVAAPRVVDEHVEAAVVGLDARDERLDLRRVGVIADDADPGAAAGADLRRGVLDGAGHVVGARARARRAPGDVDRGAGLAEDGGDGGAGAAAGAGDEGDAVGEVGHARHHRAPARRVQ